MPAVLDHWGRPIDRTATRASDRLRARWSELRARYDAAETTDDNRRHWANADLLSPDAAANPAVRRRLRSRARYECQESNSLGKGMCLTWANEVVGGGPRLRVKTKNEAANTRIERTFASWTRAVRLGPKLRTAEMAHVIDGEAFGVLANNPGIRHAVQLDVRWYEADFVSDPGMGLRGEAAGWDDGIEYDSWGNPVRYLFANRHPGDALGVLADPKPIDAAFVVHVYRQDRCGQRRGLSHLAPALPLFAQLRRFVLAVLAAAETAADVAGVMYTDSPAFSPDDIEDVESMDAVELVKRAMLTLPQGWKFGQVKAEHPTTTYEMFHRAITREMARCLLMPYNVAVGDSGGSNYASGRLDYQTFDRAIDVRRDDLEMMILDRILSDWLDEAALIDGLLPSHQELGLAVDEPLPHEWHWDGREHVDPQKNANAAATLFQAGLLDEDRYWARLGVAADEAHARMAESLNRRRALGLPLPTGQAPDSEELDPEEVEEEAASGGKD
jgi:lambda family phage portal protein